jgi:ABC-type Fe3+ transport system substrate-binding protein
VVPIPPEKNVISTVNVGVLSFSENLALAEKFVEFVVSDAGQAILAEHN